MASWANTRRENRISFFFAKLCWANTGCKADSATAADAPRPIGTEDARLEALRLVYASISSRDELEALLIEDVQQCVINGDSSAICSSVS